MRRFLTLAFSCLASVAAAQSSLDKSVPLNAERTVITGEYNKAQAQLRNAKTEAEREAPFKALAAVAVKADTLRNYIIKGNNDVISELYRQRSGTSSRSATIKTVTEKLTAANQALAALPLPTGPKFTAAEVNQIQRVLDTCKTTLDLHKHACQNLK